MQTPSILRRLFGAIGLGSAWESSMQWLQPSQRRLADGVEHPITVHEALQVPAFAAGVRLLADHVASLPVVCRDASGSKTDANIAQWLGSSWTDDQTSWEARRRLIVSAMLHRAGVAWIQRSPMGIARGIHVLDPTTVTVERMDAGIVYRVDEPDPGVPRMFHARDAIVVRYLPDTITGMGGWSAVDVAQGALRVALGAQRHSADHFGRGAVPDVLVTAPVKTTQGAQRATENLGREITRMSREGQRMMMLPSEFQPTVIGTDPTRSQMVESRRFVVEELSRVFGVPPVMLQDMSHATYSNSEQADLALAKHGLRHWVEQLESQLTARVAPRGWTVELDMSALMRSDYRGRAEGLTRLVQGGILTPDEAREKEGLEPMGGKASELFMQGATRPIEEEVEPMPTMTPDAEEAQVA